MLKRPQSPSSLSPNRKKARVSQGLVQDPGDGDEGEWTRVEKRKSKKQKKQEIKIDATGPPRFLYSNADIVKRRQAIAIDDIRDLVLHVVADAPPPNWLRVENARAITKVVTLLIPGLTPPLLSLPSHPLSATSNPNLPLAIPLISQESPSDIPFIASTFSHACPTRAPGDQTHMHSVLSAFFHGPVSGEEKKKRTAERVSLAEKVIDKDPSRFLLSLEQMVENDYPIPSYMADLFQKPDGWIETPKPFQESLLSGATQKAQPKIYAIDCEMCLTEDGKELTRVCIIDYNTGIVIYDQLVKPPKPILDYLTRWSGITAEALAPVTTTLDQVQSHLLTLLSPPSTTPTPILLGHSLESDLKALKLCHPHCIDTALVFHHPRGRPLKPGLAWLTKKWCGREIQTGGEGGHDPEEDARACLDLLKKKVENGPGYGEFKLDHESIFERMARSNRNGGTGSIRSAVVDHGSPAVMHGAKASTTVACKTDEEVLEGLLQVVPGHQFTFGRFTALADVLGWTTPKTTTPNTTALSSVPPPSTPAALLKPVLGTLSKQLSTVHASLPPRTALIIFTGHADPRRMALLNTRKSVFEGALKSGKTLEELEKEAWWTNEDGRELEEEVEKAKRGLMFVAVKM